LLKVKIDSILILIGFYIISVNTAFMPKLKEGIFFLLFAMVIILMFKENKYKLHHIIVINSIIILITFSFVVVWGISKNE